MASSYYKLEIKDRILTRTKGSKTIRRSGLIPGVLYYAGETNVNISVDKLILYHALQSGQHIFEVEQEGDIQFTMIKELQYHPVTDEVIHIDLMRVRRSEKMTISVPLVLIGEIIEGDDLYQIAYKYIRNVSLLHSKSMLHSKDSSSNHFNLLNSL